MDKELLKIENLTIGFPTKSGIHTVVDHVNLEVGKGEIVGIVGESGSGKSMTSLAVMGLLSEEAQVSEGSIQLNGQELLGMSREERRKIQGKNMSMIFQEPMTSLNPVMKIGTQVGESLKLHTDLDKEAIRGRVIEALASVGLRNPKLLVDQYPHEISGGMRQRVMIAMAIINHPDLIIADEPTTALTKQEDDEGRIRRLFGLPERALTAREKACVNRWFGEYMTPEALMKLAYDRAVEATGKVSFAYIDKILAAWAAKGITTVEAAEAERTAAQRAAAGEYSFDIGEAMRIMEQHTDE